VFIVIVCIRHQNTYLWHCSFVFWVSLLRNFICRQRSDLSKGPWKDLKRPNWECSCFYLLMGTWLVPQPCFFKQNKAVKKSINVPVLKWSFFLFKNSLSYMSVLFRLSCLHWYPTGFFVLQYISAFIKEFNAFFMCIHCLSSLVTQPWKNNLFPTGTE